MKYVNEAGFNVLSREYFLLKAILYYDRLCEMEQENFILVKRSDNDGKERSVIDLINDDCHETYPRIRGIRCRFYY